MRHTRTPRASYNESQTHMLSAPADFRGTWVELYRDHIEHILPPVESVARFHYWMKRYCEESTPIFPVRKVRGTERRKIFTTADGTLIAPADNSPATTVHALLMEGRFSSYEEFCRQIRNIPTHFFDMRRVVRETAKPRTRENGTSLTSNRRRIAIRTMTHGNARKWSAASNCPSTPATYSSSR